MNKKKFLTLLSLLFVLSYGSAWGMARRDNESKTSCCPFWYSLWEIITKKKKAPWGNLCDNEGTVVCDYLEFTDLLNIRLVNQQFYGFVDQYCKQPGWRPLEIKLPRELFKIEDIDDFTTKLQSLKNLLRKEQPICFNCLNTNITNKQFAIIIDLFQNNNLQQLNLEGCKQITNEGLNDIAKLKNLHHLSLSSCEQITNKGLVHVANLTNLQHLNLNNCSQITDEDLKCLATLKNLHHLNLGCPLCSGCNITDEGLKHLINLTQLQTLTLCRCEKPTYAGLEAIAKLKNLQKLILWECIKITNKGLEPLANLTNLRYLRVALCDNTTNDDLKHLANLTNLQYLDLGWCSDITSQGIECLTNLKKLQYLKLHWCEKITDECIKHLSNLTNLQTLKLYFGDQITYAGLKQLTNLKKLQKLKIYSLPNYWHNIIIKRALKKLKKNNPRLQIKFEKLDAILEV